MYMQANAKKKNSRAMIHKPYLKGRAVSRLSAKRGGTILAFLLVSAFLFFFLGQILVFDIIWLRSLINLFVIAAMCVITFNQGARLGERDVAFAEIQLAKKESGGAVSDEALARCFHPAKGYFTALAGAFPLVIVCLVYALIAVPASYTLGPLPSWIAPYEKRADIGLALSYYRQTSGLGAADILRLMVRLLVFPYVNLLGLQNSQALLWVERLSPLLLLIAPSFFGLGYAQGERYRAQVHGDIASNQRKFVRRQKKQQQKTPPKPRQLV